MSDRSAGPDRQEAVRRSLDAVVRRDYDRALAPFAKDAVFDLSASGAEVVEGHEGIRKFLETWQAPYDKFELELEQFRDHGNDVTLSVIAQRGRLAGSSSFLFVRGGHVAIWRDGLINHNTVFPEPDIDEARAAAERLAEEGREEVSEMSTTPDLVKLQKLLTEAGNRRDLDAIMAFFAPDGVYDMSPTGMGVFEAQAAARGFIEDWFVSYEEYELDAEEILDLGNGVGFRVLMQRGRPVGSSGIVELRYATVSVWEDGKIARLTNYNDVAQARAAAERLAEERGWAAPDESAKPELEPLRRFAEALGRRDLEAAVAAFASDAILDTSAAGGLGGVYRGREAILGFLEAWITPFEDYENAVEESRHLGSGVTFNVYMARGRPSAASEFVDRRSGAVSISRDGLVERCTVYADIDEARAAAERLAEERG